MNKYYFFVDYENVNVDGMNGIDKLTENCTVIIFYTDHAQTLTFGLHRRMNLSRAEIKFRKVQCGTKNALDFQLSSHLGYTICENKYVFPDDKFYYYIVSKDTGFNVLEDYFSFQKVCVKVIDDLTTNNFKILPEVVKKDEPKAKVQETNENTSDKPVSVISVILKCVPNNSFFAQELYGLFKSGRGEKEINNCIQKYIKNGEEVKKIYNQLKPFIK